MKFKPAVILLCLPLLAVCVFSPMTGHAQIGRIFDQAIESSQPKVVKIFGAGAGRVEGYSTGLLVSGEGHIVTTQGVYLDGAGVRVILHDGSAFEAAILKRNRETQLALLKIEAQTPEFYEITDEPVGEKGDWIVAVTNAFRVADKDEPLSVMLGVVALRTSMDARYNRRDIAYMGDLVLIDAITSNPGAGGGAVLLSDGSLVGMVGKIINSSETNTRLNYAVPGNVLRAFIDGDPAQVQVEEQERKEAELGIVIFKHGGRGGPAYVDRVRRSGPAADAGLKSDDLIVTLAGEKVGSVREYEDVVSLLTPDEEIVVVVKRGSEVLRLSLTPVEKE